MQIIALIRYFIQVIISSVFISKKLALINYLVSLNYASWKRSKISSLPLLISCVLIYTNLSACCHFIWSPSLGDLCFSDVVWVNSLFHSSSFCTCMSSLLKSNLRAWDFSTLCSLGVQDGKQHRA